MTNEQLCLMIGVPTFANAIMIGVLFVNLHVRFRAIESRCAGGAMPPR